LIFLDHTARNSASGPNCSITIEMMAAAAKEKAAEAAKKKGAEKKKEETAGGDTEKTGEEYGVKQRVPGRYRYRRITRAMSVPVLGKKWIQRSL